MNENTGALAYMLAHTRRGPYYLGTAADIKAIQDVVRDNSFYREYAGEKNFYDPVALVWYEEYATLAAASRRAAQIRNWPLRWQRQLIESTNPQWWEQTAIAVSLPKDWWYAVPEIAPTEPPPRPEPTQNPILVLPDDPIERARLIAMLQS
jgi:putative endonuclease